MRYKNTPSIRSLIFLSFVLFIANSSAIAQKCLNYGPTVSLTGTLTSHVFPGPPNYESIKRGDSKETAIILKLDASMCTTDDGLNGFNVSVANIREMQLAIYNDDKKINDQEWKVVHERIGKRVVVTGTLYGAHTGHHRTKVLIDVSHIDSK